MRTTKILLAMMLMVFYNSLYRNPCKDTFPAREQHRLPETAHTAITINKRMDKFKLVMEHTRMNQRMLFRSFHPMEKVAHQLWHTISRRRHVKAVAISIEHAHTLLTVVSCLFHKVFHHQSMSLQQILLLEGIEFWLI